MKTLRIFKNEKGFSLPVALILMVVLTFSGLAFLHSNFLEKRSSMEARGDQKAFYLAQAGIERARQAFKIAIIGGVPSWTPLLDPTNPNHPAEYPADTSPDPLLCPDVTRGCVIPPFQTAAGNPGRVTANGQAITAPDIPFSAVDDPGFYSVRAFNNSGSGDSGKTDGDDAITIRAIGNVNGHVKVLEVTARATTDMRLMNCIDNPNTPSLDPCPNIDISWRSEPRIDYADGRDPQTFPVSDLPAMVPDLASSGNFYRNASNFPGLTPVTVSGTSLSPQHGRYYYKDGNVTLNSAQAGTGQIVVFATGTVTVAPLANISDVTVVGAQRVVVNPGSTVRSPLPYPAIVAGDGGVVGWSLFGFANIYGNVYSTGTIALLNMKIHGNVIGTAVNITWGNLSLYTDDNNPDYYDFMPGFTYPDQAKKTSVVLNGWKEVQ